MEIQKRIRKIKMQYNITVILKEVKKEMAKHRWTIPEGFAKRLREAIQARGMTGEQVADELDIYPANMYGYLHGKTCMNIGRLQELCDVLDVSADWLLSESGQMDRK